jgi:hypothetical protein
MQREWLGDRVEEFGGFYMKRAGQGDDVEEGNVALTALDAADIVAMEVGQFRQLFLRQTAFESQLANVSSKDGSGVGWHMVIIRLMTTMSLHTMSVIPFPRSARANCPRGSWSQKRVIWCARCPSLSDSGDKGWNRSIRNCRKDFKIGELLSLT